MAIERRDATTEIVVTTECALCGDDIAEQQSIADHLRTDCEGADDV